MNEHLRQEVLSDCFETLNDSEFNNIALIAFKYQYLNNNIYKQYVDAINKNIDDINYYTNIPFLPISFYKNHIIKSTEGNYQKVFLSSGTTQDNLSKHYITDISLYEKSFMICFEYFFGSISEYNIIALVPGYKPESSLVYMLTKLIKESKSDVSGFYYENFEKLKNILSIENNRKTILFGVTHALIDFAESHHCNYPELIVVETGGMKGRNKEMTRQEIQEKIKALLGTSNVFSEYGMTELLSQAYSLGNSFFSCPPWMKILIRDVKDPFTILNNKITGGVNIIDLANIDSCCFVETQDLGKLSDNNTFEILGRFDYSEIRGCNLMVNS